MVSERIQRRIDTLLDEVDEALARADWATVRQHCATVLSLDPSNAEATTYLEAADRASPSATSELAPPDLPLARGSREKGSGGEGTLPASFVAGR